MKRFVIVSPTGNLYLMKDGMFTSDVTNAAWYSPKSEADKAARLLNTLHKPTLPGQPKFARVVELKWGGK